MGVSFIYHEDPKADLKLMRKLFEDRDMYAALQGGTLTVTGGNTKKDVQEMANVLFDEDSCILQEKVKWKSGVSGVCQLLLALELDRRVC